ncbi:hypothetical protein BDZ89DRAFT_1075828 [Hymenopellis radicata]|nr:hypothetical protein BDZ89DRAFT_1075828 [Hymenopellis radicata]
MLHRNCPFERYPNQTIPPEKVIMLPSADFIPPPVYARGRELSFYQGYIAAFQAAFNLLHPRRSSRR